MSNTNRKKRIVYYYDVDFEENKDYDFKKEDPFNALFRIITKMVNDKEEMRYQNIGQKRVFISDINFDSKNKLVIAKVRSV